MQRLQGLKPQIMISNKNNNEKLVYYLRPLQKGEFVTEAAIMQSLDATKEVRLTDENKLVIK